MSRARGDKPFHPRRGPAVQLVRRRLRKPRRTLCAPFVAERQRGRRGRLPEFLSRAGTGAIIEHRGTRPPAPRVGPRPCPAGGDRTNRPGTRPPRTTATVTPADLSGASALLADASASQDLTWALVGLGGAVLVGTGVIFWL